MSPEPRWRNRPRIASLPEFLPITAHSLPDGYSHYSDAAIVISVLSCIASPLHMKLETQSHTAGFPSERASFTRYRIYFRDSSVPLPVAVHPLPPSLTSIPVSLSYDKPWAMISAKRSSDDSTILSWLDAKGCF